MAVFTAIGAWAFGAGTFLATLTAGALQVAAGVAMSLIAKSISGSRESESPKFGVQGKLQGGDAVPRSILLGYCATAGSFVYGNTWGTASGVPNAYLTQVIALADYPIRELLTIEVNGSPDTMITAEATSLGWPVAGFRRGGVDHMWVKFYDGSQTTADGLLVGSVSSAARPYDSTRVGRGVPYVIVTTMAPERRDGEENPLFSNGIPRFKFYLNGARLFDPSNGTHVWENPATWGGDGDFLPAVQAYNLMRGITYAGQWLYGLQATPAARVPLAWWASQANKCRAPIEGPSGDEPTYRTGGEIQVGAQIRTAIEAMLTGCQGRLTEIGGVYKLHVGDPGSPVISFTDADILSTEEQMFTPFYGLEDTVNGIQATYPNPAEAWATKTAPPLIRTDLEERDGNRRLMSSVSLDMVPYTGQVQRLMLSALREAQRARRHTFVMGPEFWVLEPGDVVEWTSARNGYVSKLMRVDGMADQAKLNVMLDLTEVDPSDYDWNQDEDFSPVVDGPVQLVGTPPMPMIGWQVYGVPVLDELGRERRPGIEVWYQSGLQGIRDVRVQVRIPGATNPFIDIAVPYGEPWKIQIPGNFPPLATYEVRGVFVMEAGGDALWSDWLEVTTPDVKLIAGLDFDPFEGVIGFDQLGDDLAGWINWIGLTPRELMEAIQDGNTSASDQELANSDTFRQVRQELAVSLGSVSASFTQTITVAIVPLQNSVAAIADYLTELSAGDGADVSTARFRMTTVSGEAGYSTIGAETRVDTADPNAWRGAAWFLSTPNDPMLPTRFLVNADQFIVISGSDAANPFVFDGTLRVGDALVRNASIANATITGAKIADATITNALIEDATITGAKIANASIGSAQIADAAITTAKIGSATIETANIKSGNVTETSAFVDDSTISVSTSIGVETTVGTITTSATVGQVIVQAEFTIATSSAFVARIRKNGSLLSGKTYSITGSYFGPVRFIYVDSSPSPSTYTITVEPGFSGGTAAAVAYRSILLQNNKR